MKRIGVLALAAVLALGLVGAGFAHWTETLTINDANTDTGELKVEFLGYGIRTNDGEGMKDPTCKWQRRDYDVGKCLIQKVDAHTMRITLTKAYPDYAAWVEFGLKNTGSIGAKIKDVQLNVISDPGGLLPYIRCAALMNLQTAPSGWTQMAVNGYPESKCDPFFRLPWAGYLKNDSVSSKGDFAASLKSALSGHELKPGWNMQFQCPDYPESSLVLAITDDAAPEGATLTFDLVMTWTQFNDA